MNINKILTKISFDELMTLVNNAGTHIENNNSCIAAMLTSIDKSNSIGHNLFLYFIQKMYKKENKENLKYLFFNDSIFSYLYNENLIIIDTLETYYKYFSSITPELNTYFLYVITTESSDKEYLYNKNKTFISDLYKFNEQKVATDKNFVLDYIHYVKILPVHLDILTQIYPDLIQTNINKISDKKFVNDFYTNIIKYNDEVLTLNFVNKYYMFLLSGIISIDAITLFTAKKSFFKLSEFTQRKIKEFLSNNNF